MDRIPRENNEDTDVSEFGVVECEVTRGYRRLCEVGRAVDLNVAR
jgi:hypothetical protein